MNEYAIIEQTPKPIVEQVTKQNDELFVVAKYNGKIKEFQGKNKLVMSCQKKMQMNLKKHYMKPNIYYQKFLSYYNNL